MRLTNQPISCHACGRDTARSGQVRNAGGSPRRRAGVLRGIVLRRRGQHGPPAIRLIDGPRGFALVEWAAIARSGSAEWQEAARSISKGARHRLGRDYEAGYRGPQEWVT